GFLHHDLFLWRPESNQNRRLTRLADVKDADPLPDGKRAIAVRSRFGFSQLVEVNLTSGAIEEHTRPSLLSIVSHPRAGTDGRIAWAEHDPGGWHVVVDGRSVSSGFSPEWGPNGALFSVVADRGFIEVARDGDP